MRQRHIVLTVLAVGVLHVPRLAAQDQGLRQAAERARAAWLAHDVGSLVDADSLTLRLRGTDEEAGAIPKAQAARILSRYLAPASEVALDLRQVRPAGGGQGYAEAGRRFVVKGTADPMVETVLFGFRLA